MAAFGQPGFDSDPFGGARRAMQNRQRVGLQKEQLAQTAAQDKINNEMRSREMALNEQNAKIEADRWQNTNNMYKDAAGLTSGILGGQDGTGLKAGANAFGVPEFGGGVSQDPTVPGGETQPLDYGASGGPTSYEGVGAVQESGGGDMGGGGMLGGMMGGGGGIGGGGGALEMMSSKRAKTGRRPQSDDQSLGALEQTPVNKYRYTKDSGQDDGREHVHSYAEDLKKNAGIGNGKMVDLGDEIGMHAGAIRAIAKRLGALEKAG